ncbi:hypothetical protein HIM_00658 [Hirsutella minnesotensis 3608]|nr:hypothetical protein HIM_00658 [Hirsutella minnesotensis 3608]
MLRIAARCAVRPSLAAGLRLPTWNLFKANATTDAAILKKPKLRDYQEECIKSVLSSLRQGCKRVGISLATGSGKTVVFTQLIDEVPPRPGGGDRTLILAHRRELVEQAARHCHAAYPDKSIEIEMGSIHASGTADITVASVQSITSRERLEKFDPSSYKLVLVDEAHHIVASSYLKTLKHFGLEKKQVNSPTLIGVSATFSRFDGVKIGAAIDEIVYHKDYMDMISGNYLSQVMFTTVKSSANLSKVRNGAFGDFQTGELSKAVNTDEVNDITVRSWMAKAEGRKSTLVFCVDLAHVVGLTNKFRDLGFDARYVTGDTPKLERSEILDAFRAGEFPVLINCSVFTEGTDIPNIDCIVLARPTRSRNLLVQMIGRGMRLYPGKENCHVIDLVSTLDTGIVTTPTLFGLDPSELVDKASASEMKQLKERREAEQGSQEASQAEEESGRATGSDISLTFTDYSSVLDLIADSSGERHIHAISQYAWVQVGPGRYVLSAPSGSYIRIETIEERRARSEPMFRAIEVRALPQGLTKYPYAAPREILTASTFYDAVHGADRYAADAFPHTFIHRYQSWRRLPPTQGQLDFLNRICKGRGKPLRPADLTKGKAADMITKLKHGARGHFAKMEARHRRRDKLTLALEERQSRERVTVGPLVA